MAIDMSKMRARKTALENRGNGGSQFWRPQDGEQTIRIVPTADGDPFKDFWFHYNVGNNSGFLSPKKNFGEDDPLDAFVRKLFNEGTEESVKMAKNLMARQRFFAPVIVRGEEHKGSLLISYSILSTATSPTRKQAQILCFIMGSLQEPHSRKLS